MKIERLRNKKSKLIFLCGCLMVVVLLMTAVINGSKARYRSSQIIPLINGTVTNNTSDFTTMGIFIKNSSGEYVKQENDYIIPDSGYLINEEKSYCYKTNPNERDTNAKLYTNIMGKHSMEGISKGSKCYIYLEEGSNKYISAKAFLLNMWGYEDISKITERPETDFTGTTKVIVTGRDTTNNRDWLYKAPDDDGTSYYLAGTPKYNWVKFGGHYWRILRINGDGSIRMIYSGTGAPAEKGDGTQLSKNEVAGISDNRTYPYNPTHDNAIYVGYKYTAGQLHGKTTASPIYNLVNSFYVNGIANSDKKYIDKNAGFCNDRTLAADNPAGSTGFGSTVTYFAPKQRIYGSPMTRPILTCPDKNNDLFTATNSTKGNKALDNPIGLITVDEASLAGLLYYYYGTTTENYLHTGRYYWSMSPDDLSFSKGTPYAGVWGVLEGGSLGSDWVRSGSFGVRPVVNLVKNVTFSKGNGSISSPFEI